MRFSPPTFRYSTLQPNQQPLIWGCDMSRLEPPFSTDGFTDHTFNSWPVTGLVTAHAMTQTATPFWLFAEPKATK